MAISPLGQLLTLKPIVTHLGCGVGCAVLFQVRATPAGWYLLTCLEVASIYDRVISA